MSFRIYLYRLFILGACFLPLGTAAATPQYLFRVPPPEEGSELDLGPRAAGTLLFKGASDGEWQPATEATDAAGFGVGNLQSPVSTAQVELPAGRHDFLLEFRDLARVDRLAFRQEGAADEVRVYAADGPYPPESPRWRMLHRATPEEGRPVVDLRFPVTSMRHFRVSLDYPAGGKIGPLHLPDNKKLANGGAAIPPPDEWPDSAEREEFDFARLTAGGRIAYIGSGRGEEAYRKLDGDPTTFFDFEGKGQDALFITALAEDYPVEQASIATMEAISRVEIWVFDSDPREILIDENENGNGNDSDDSFALRSEFFSERAPAGRVVVPEDEEVTSLNIPFPESNARYLLVRVAGKDPEQPVRVSQFSVVGRVPEEYLGDRAARPSALEATEPNEPEPERDPPQINFASP
ncbi:MAG: hypothetical protein R6U56_01340 [Opitutales bacterium]